MVNLARRHLVSQSILCLALAGPATARLAASAPAAPAAPPAPAIPLDADTEIRMLDRNYRLGRGDVIDIAVADHPEYSDTVAVHTDGTIDQRVLGKIQALGLTTEALAEQITEGMKKELRRPLVTVQLKKIYIPPKPPVVEAPKLKITALGAVSSRGEIEIGYAKPLRVVLAQVGPLPSADLAHIRVRYADGKGRECDFSRFAVDGFSKDDITIKGGEEIVFVEQPPILKPEPLRFTVLGAVAKPGTYLVDGSATILEALEKAGGAKTSAEMEQVKIEGPSHANPVLVNVDKYISGDLSANYVVKPNDNIVVPDKPWKILVVGEIQHPGYMNIREGETMLEVFLAAGQSQGGDEYSKAELIRRAPDGKAKRQTVDIHAIIRDPNKKNVKMAQGDVVYVPHKKMKRGLTYYLSTIASPLWLMRSISPSGGFP